MNQCQLDGRCWSHILPLLKKGNHFINVDIGSKYVSQQSLNTSVLKRAAGRRTRGHDKSRPTEYYNGFYKDTAWTPDMTELEM
jgi:hypothetical protein